MKKVLSFDFGASSGRAMLSVLENGKITMQEIHRFGNDPVMVNRTMYWDILRLFHEIKAGITKAVHMGGFDAIGIDTWGVDFGLIDKNGDLISNPVHYRDTRTDGVFKEVFKIISRNELYKRTGIQFMRFNTLYQLMYLKLNRPEILEKAESMLMIPDLFCYMLTGQKRAEASIASTTNLLDPYKRDWDYELIRRLDLPERIFPPIIKAGRVSGMLSDDICKELGCPKVPVIAVAEHDTASAVAAAPNESENFVYISCGTWSLFGTESAEPIISDSAAQADFTNENGFKNTVRFLKNIMGLWLIQESRRQWKREGEDVSFDTLEKEALACEPFKCFINVDDPVFETAGDIPGRVREFCAKTEQYVPKTRGEIMRCLYESLAMKYKYTFEKIEDISGKKYSSINMLGGGIKDKLLCRLTADACGAKVLAGPVEATAMGNAAVAYSALGEIEDFSRLRRVTVDSSDITVYEPSGDGEFRQAYPRYLDVLKKSGIKI